MSSHEDYDRTSANYDKTRSAYGVEVILGCFNRAPVPLNDMAMLDAGCGTGNYARALLAHVGRIDAIDANEGMLAVAAKKLAEQREQGRISFRCSRLDDLPFDDGRFDGILINQVLHHLEDDVRAGFPTHRRILAECARTLRPGGVLVIGTCSHAQLSAAYWYYELIPMAVEALRSRYIPLDVLQDLGLSVGLEHRGQFVPTDGVVQGEPYFDPYGPLKQEWRDGDSIWALASRAELDRALEQVRSLKERGVLAEFVQRHDRHRPEIGQVTFLALQGAAGRTDSTAHAKVAR